MHQIRQQSRSFRYQNRPLLEPLFQDSAGSCSRMFRASLDATLIYLHVTQSRFSNMYCDASPPPLPTPIPRTFSITTLTVDFDGQEEIKAVIKQLQGSTRALQHICAHAKVTADCLHIHASTHPRRTNVRIQKLDIHACINVSAGQYLQNSVSSIDRCFSVSEILCLGRY